MRLRFKERETGKEIYVSFPKDSTLTATSDRINEKSYFTESYSYSVELLFDDDERINVVSVLVTFNDDNNLLSWEKEDNSLFQERKYFLEQIDLIQFFVSLGYTDNSVEKRISDFYLCNYANEDDYNNIKKIINGILEFNDEHIVAHMFSFTSGKSALLRAAYLPKSYKTLRTIVKVVTEICACYRLYLPYFQRKAHHRIITDRAVVPIDSVRHVTESSVYWLTQTPEALYRSNSKDIKTSLPNNFDLLALESPIENRSYDVYENRVCNAFLTKILAFIQELEYRLSESKKCTEAELCKYNQIEGFRAPVLILKNQFKEIQDTLCDQIKSLRSELFSLKAQYKRVLNCRNIELASLPIATKVFLCNPVYHAFFRLISIWFRDGEFEQAGDDRIFKIKTTTQLFEIYCLQQILRKFIAEGFKFETVGAFAFQYPGSNKNHLVANTYKFSREGVRITLYYEPVIYSSLPKGECGNTMPNELELYKLPYGDRGGSWKPDFVIKFENQNESYYAILDAKFAYAQRIWAPRSKDNRGGHLSSIIEKYYTYTACFNKSKTCMVWTLQGRIDKGCKFLRFGSSRDISPKFKPTVSFGNCPINSDEQKSAINELWNEMCLMIPFMERYNTALESNLESIPKEAQQHDMYSARLTSQIHSNETLSIRSSKSDQAIFSQDEKRSLHKHLWDRCKNENETRKHFRPLPPPTCGDSYTLHNNKKLDAKIYLKADIKHNKIVVYYKLPHIHKQSQKEVCRKLENNKQQMHADLNNSIMQPQIEWTQCDNTLTISLKLDCSFVDITDQRISELMNAAAELKKCIDKYS